MEDIYKLDPSDFPPCLLEIPEPPKKLFIRGKLPNPEEFVYLGIVGSRKYTSYGKDVLEKLVDSLKGYPVVIVSGLALGIDSLAHRRALQNNILTLAIPGSGLDRNVLYPATNFHLAEEILEKGGCLLSEFEPNMRATLWSFPRRNRVMAGLCKAILIIEAEEKSGTLITARLAVEYNRDVLVVPGPIFSDNSKGTNQFIRLGATPITSSDDLLEALGFEKDNQQNKQTELNLSSEEKLVLEIIKEPLSKDILISKLGMETSKASILLSLMEIKGLIKEEFGEIRKN